MRTKLCGKASRANSVAAVLVALVIHSPIAKADRYSATEKLVVAYEGMSPSDPKFGEAERAARRALSKAIVGSRGDATDVGYGWERRIIVKALSQEQDRRVSLACNARGATPPIRCNVEDFTTLVIRSPQCLGEKSVGYMIGLAQVLNLERSRFERMVCIDPAYQGEQHATVVEFSPAQVRRNVDVPKWYAESKRTVTEAGQPNNF